MELTNTFTVTVPVDEAWTVLTDIERIAPCMPGAQLREIEGEEYRGDVKVKVGPIATSYKGALRFLEKDDVAHRAVMKAEARETRGQGNAAAIITASLATADSGTVVTVVTDLTITGKVAQFGRGALADVSAKLLEQFVDNLETTVLTEPVHTVDEVATAGATQDHVDTEGDDATRAEEPAIRQIHAPEAAPVDLMEVAGSTRIAMVIRIVGIVTLVVLVLSGRRRRARKKKA